jgi:hypothetical protein
MGERRGSSPLCIINHDMRLTQIKLQKYHTTLPVPVTQTKQPSEAARILLGLIDSDDNVEEPKSLDEEYDHYIGSGCAHWKTPILQYWHICRYSLGLPQ